MDIGTPEERPGVIVEPVKDPVPRENPKPAPKEPSVPVREREKVPA